MFANIKSMNNEDQLYVGVGVCVRAHIFQYKYFQIEILFLCTIYIWGIMRNSLIILSKVLLFLFNSKLYYSLLNFIE